jgi:ABC-2 type transport system ATP-binding protein
MNDSDYGKMPQHEEQPSMIVQENQLSSCDQPGVQSGVQSGDAASVVSLRGLTKDFGDLRAVDQLSLEIRPGETLALLGPNGAGKTTTIAMLLGLLAPNSGSARILGMAPAAAIQSGCVGAMLQDGGMMPGVTVGELLDFVLALRPSATTRQHLVATAGLGGLERRRVDRLSGGQTQRLRFALAIASEPTFLVLDEPTAAMDVEARHSFWASMREYTSAGRTVLFATHYLEEAEAFASRVVIVAHGQIVADGTVADLKRRAGTQTVRFATEHGVSGKLERLPAVTRVEWQGNDAVLTTHDADATVRGLASSDIGWRNLDVRSADLNDIFLALVGNDK